jgi:hypothetical protein
VVEVIVKFWKVKIAIAVWMSGVLVAVMVSV